MTSKPTTPLNQRRIIYPGEERTRIPQSPNPFRRSHSLRLRDPHNNSNGKNNKLGFTNSHSCNASKDHSPLGPLPLDLVARIDRELNQGDNLEKSCDNRTNIPDTIPECSKRQHHGMTLNLSSNHSPPSPANPPKPISPQTPKSVPGTSRLITPKTPPVTPDSVLNGDFLDEEDDEVDSVYSCCSSVASGRTNMCEHSYAARNGTTFSGRRMKYVVHCSSFAGQVGNEYLTPTQRAQRQIRRLRELLLQAKQDLENKDSEILRLTKEVVELRLFKASLGSPDDRSNSSDAVTVRENNDPKTSTDISPIVDMVDEALKISPKHLLHAANHQHLVDKLQGGEMHSSFADSGHFEDMTNSSIHSKDSYAVTTTQKQTDNSFEHQREQLISMYEKRIEDLVRDHENETQEVKKNHNDRVEALLHKLSEAQARYSDLMPDYELAKEKIRELESKLDELQSKLKDQEEEKNKMYLAMYAKGQEAEKIQREQQIKDMAAESSSRISIPDLMNQLQSTQDELKNITGQNRHPSQQDCPVLLSAKEAISLWLVGARKTMYERLLDSQQSRHNRVDPEVTLQFLKSAVYYFLTDKENSQGHLAAIESILGFSEQEKAKIEQARKHHK